MKEQSRQQYIYEAKIAKDAKRFENMIDTMNKIAQFPDVFNAEERNMLVVAYKNTTEPLRRAWRVLNRLQKKEEWKGSKNIHVLKGYKDTIQQLLSKHCWKILGLIDTKFLRETDDREAQVFFLKMKGDYYKYIAEITIIIGQNHDVAVKNIQEAYKRASEIAAIEMSATYPLRLGLALNYSNFLYEFKDIKPAIQLAQNIFDDAIAGIEQIKEEHYKDSTVILSLLRDNLTLWKSSLQEDNK